VSGRDGIPDDPEDRERWLSVVDEVNPLLAESVRSLAARPVLSREAVLLALARADGQPWSSIAEATPHTAEVMYGAQADAVLDVLTAGGEQDG
jgi:uncharacterized tellurite resistance protein B-like protein